MVRETVAIRLRTAFDRAEPSRLRDAVRKARKQVQQLAIGALTRRTLHTASTCTYNYEKRDIDKVFLVVEKGFDQGCT